MLEGVFIGCKQRQTVRKEQTVDPAASNSDTLIPTVAIFCML